MTREILPDAPNPPVAPPLLFLAFFLAAYFLNILIPLPVLPMGWSLIPALLFTLGGVLIFASAAWALRRAGTPLSVFKPAKKLLTTGAYLRTRNPTYLAFAWIYLGFSCWTISAWPFLLFPAAIYAVNRFVIFREEAHLEARFGQTYRDYKAGTRRWM
jgi:protein-S-isoprenylcysteine O-methyltransferase Ste14